MCTMSFNKFIKHVHVCMYKASKAKMNTLCILEWLSITPLLNTINILAAVSLNLNIDVTRKGTRNPGVREGVKSRNGRLEVTISSWMLASLNIKLHVQVLFSFSKSLQTAWPDIQAITTFEFLEPFLPSFDKPQLIMPFSGMPLPVLYTAFIFKSITNMTHI